MKTGDKVQYNKKYNPEEVVIILQMDKTHALIQFSSGGKIATPIAGLWQFTEQEQQTGQIVLF